MAFYLIDDVQLARLQAAATRLYSEERMHGDQMRDMAQTLDAIVRVCSDLAVPEDPSAWRT